jgi:hypothetical protein
MKNLLTLSVILIGLGVTFGQEKSKKNDIDVDINVKLDSLSKIYHVKVGAIIVNNYPNLRITSITML